MNKKIVSLLGRKADSLICIGEPKGHNVICKCEECGQVQTKDRYRFQKLTIDQNSTSHIPCENENCKYHSYRGKYLVGINVGSYKILDISGDKVKVQCNTCKDIRYMSLDSLKRRSYCRNENCSEFNENSKIGLFKSKYTVGNSYNNLTILSIIEQGIFEVKCDNCGEVFITRYTSFLDGYPHCKNVNCTNFRKSGRRADTEAIISLVKNNIECVSYERVNGTLGIRLKCLVCGEEFVTCCIPDFKANKVFCRNTKCKNCRYYDYSNEGTDRVKVVKSLQGQRLLVECLKCGTQFESYRSAIKNNTCVCVNTECINHNPVYKKMIGKKYGDFILTDIVNLHKFLLTCSVCGKSVYYSKSPTKRIICNSHPRKRLKTGVYFDKIMVLNYEFTYNNLDYFICKCQKCGKRDILNVKQMLEHKCEVY